MTVIREVSGEDTPNGGRLIWNSNDLELERRLSSVALNVKAAPYYAVGDGVADDRIAIQTALNDCSEAGGGQVFLPAGVYLLTSGPLLLPDGANMVGAGMNVSTIKLGDGANGPVITDLSAGYPDTYAFGRIRLAHFAVDGNRQNNVKGEEGIFTTAYYSVFEQLYVHDCQTDGVHFGFAQMKNSASQNWISGCRITDCGGAGVYLDIQGIDHSVSDNFIHDCDYGVVINNGGVRVINNDIFACYQAAIKVKQTAYGVILANNDLNANRQHGIHITRTSDGKSGPWSQILIANNSILGDGLTDDGQYDGIYVESPTKDGIDKLTIVGNKVFSREGSNRFRYGIDLEKNISETKCSGNHISNAASGQYFVGSSCSQIEIDSIGGGEVDAPSMPDSTTVLVNPYPVAVTIYISGGVVQSVAVAGKLTGLTNGSFRLTPGQTIAVEYAELPSWVWIAD